MRYRGYHTYVLQLDSKVLHQELMQKGTAALVHQEEVKTIRNIAFQTVKKAINIQTKLAKI